MLKLLKHIESLHLASQETHTTIYRASWRDNEAWGFDDISKPKRPLSSVTLRDDVKGPLVQHIESYLSEETAKFYAARGIALRRSYLLWGAPGTGKTSFSASIVGHFGLDLFVISLNDPNLDDNGLVMLFDGIGKRSVVLLENVDSAGIVRENMRRKSTAANKAEKLSVSLSGLLNVIDGVASKEGSDS